MNIRRPLRVFSIALLTLWISATAYAFFGNAKWTGTFEAKMEKITWAYRVVALSLDTRIADGSFESDLNALGAQGWELEALVTTQAGGYYVMKKPSA